MNDRTIARLTKALTPHVGARQRGGPRAAGVAIHLPGVSYSDANIRAVGPEGITIFWWDGRDGPVPWSDVRRIETYEIGRRYGQPIRIRRRYAA